MKKALLLIVLGCVAASARAQSDNTRPLVVLGKAYHTYLFANDPTAAAIRELEAETGSGLQRATRFVVQAITPNNALLTKPYLTLPDDSTLKQLYVTAAVSHNLYADEPADNRRVVDSVRRLAIPRAELVYNYYTMLFLAVGNKNKPDGIAAVDFRIRDYHLADETEAGIFFLTCMRACNSSIWGYFNIAKPRNTAAAYALIRRFPTFSGQPYYQYADFNFPDFQMVIVDDEGRQSFKRYFLNKYYELLLYHLICLRKEGAPEAAKSNLLLGSILRDERYYKYTVYKPELQALFQKTSLQFDKHYTDCEDKWVAFQADSTGKHAYGFVYIDEQAGLTLQFGGDFRIDENDRFIPVPTTPALEKTNLKVRLQPNDIVVAILPADKLQELGVAPVPAWLAAYKTDTGAPKRLYRWGYLYNVYERPDLALPYLERAYAKQPAYENLAPELAYTYNALGQYAKTVSVLRNAAVGPATACYYYKEYSYAQLGLNDPEAAAATVRKALPACNDAGMKAEMSYNVAYHFYKVKQPAAAKAWLRESKAWAKPGDAYDQRITALEGALDGK